MSKNEKLQEYFDFTVDDLEENIQGRITEDQQLLVKNKLQNEISGVVFIAIVLGFITLVFNIGRFSNEADFKNSLILPGFIAVFVALFILFRYGKKSDYSLKTIEGRVNFVWVERTVRGSSNFVDRTTPRLKMRVKDVSFDVREGLMDILDQGDICRFYYTGGGDIVAAKVIDNKDL